MNNLISLKEYAEMHDVKPATVRQKILRGNLPAKKIANVWLIDKDQTYTDNRIKSGKYIKNKEDDK